MSSKAELPGLYAGAAAFLYPGIYEGFGLPIVEAMACGTPVVTSTTGAAPEIAGGAAVLVDPFDVAGIEAGIERVMQPDEAVRLRGLGRERIRFFDWSTAADATIEAYRARIAQLGDARARAGGQFTLWSFEYTFSAHWPFVQRQDSGLWIR